MAVLVGARVNVGPTATLIAAASNQAVLVKNLGTATIDIGGADVTSGDGWPLEPGASVSLDLVGRTAVYGITASGTVAVAALRMVVS